jgi:hypothetical protein
VSHPRIVPPQPLEFVSADYVRALVEGTDREFADLEERATAARAEAEAAESGLHDRGIDPEISSWAMVQLQRYLESLRDEVARESDTTLALARQLADHRVREAAAEAAHLRSLSYPEASPTPAAPEEAPMPDAALRPTFGTTPPIVEPTPLVAPPPVSTPLGESSPRAVEESDEAASPSLVPGVAAEEYEPHAAATPVAPTETEPPGSPRVAWVADPLVPEVATAKRQPVADELPPDMAPTGSLSAAAVSSGPAPDVPGTPAVAQPSYAAPAHPQPQYVAAEPVAPAPRKRRRALGGFPVYAILEILAVLLILVFILMRLS